MSDLKAHSGHIDLTNCDREPIHILGHVQPFGFLLALSRDFTVVSASTNAGAFLGLPQDKIVGAQIEDLFDTQTIHLIRGRMQIAARAGFRGADFRPEAAAERQTVRRCGACRRGDDRGSTPSRARKKVN